MKHRPKFSVSKTYGRRQPPQPNTTNQSGIRGDDSSQNLMNSADEREFLHTQKKKTQHMATY